MLKKPNTLWGSVQLLNSQRNGSSSILNLASTARSYATASDTSGYQDAWPKSPSFTPYDILNIPRNGTYTKTRYYDLVKLYHPDRHSADITPEVRLQRYKIVVAAHEILSDPVKRAAYDKFGTGWNHASRPDPTGPDGPDVNIYGNATWEDWERWNNRHNGKQQHIVDHRTFTRLIILLTLFGGAVQASWIGQMNTGYEERLREVSEDSMRFLSGRRQSAVNQMPSNDARVQSFLIRRDPTGSGLKGDEHPVYQRELHPKQGVKKLSERQGVESQTGSGHEVNEVE
ncbi:uncharacterized protein N7484_006192 [Penicillium longicatenatum]|uniref:uncharacterized protein n=1 Tax=Penicillium longicatenatum TaxID=1561947 RepID=UPI002548324F|nr:uncharacterized protein N7484_006192 [Penicillium longicatenatum]KAJ5643685.1 hypothetical protein N7484_006192 [Penicillium longicatenatum]